MYSHTGPRSRPRLVSEDGDILARESAAPDDAQAQASERHLQIGGWRWNRSSDKYVR